MTYDMKNSMKRYDKKRSCCIMTSLRLIVMMLLMMGVGEVLGQTTITSLSQITASDGNYVITADISGGTSGVSTFSGTLTAQAKADGTFPVISGITQPLFTTATDATISNIMFKSIAVSGSGPVGAICGTANGATRIYNCGILPTNSQFTETSTVSSSNGYCGGFVGFLDGTARVVNCFSYANIISGTTVAGIVGYNNYASKSAGVTGGEIRTMVMNCMFYGDIDTENTTNIVPIYGGMEIKNEGTNSEDSRLNNYNYFRYESSYSKNNTTANPLISKYNRALPAEERYLKRFEFYRYLLNSNRELAAAYIGDTPTEYETGNNLVKRYHKERMAKWVLDKSIAPYPVLKQQGTYPSVINYNQKNLPDSATVGRNNGGRIGTLTVNVSVGSGGPTDAAIKEDCRQLTLVRTDKDTLNYNFNYNKVQLPYYNDVGTNNYHKDANGVSRVVTGWKVRTSSKAKSFGTANYDYPNYNLADRACVEGRVYSQGAYFDVPDGTTSISIEAYWGTAVYLSDGYHDCYSNDNDYSPQGLGDFGKKYINKRDYYINPSDNSDANKQKVYTSIDDAVGALPDASSVYDNAVVLVGNFHRKGTPSSKAKKFTIMSADLDHDNEPDYSLIIRSGKGENISEIRFDFINVPGVVMAHKKTSTTQMGILGNMKPKGWFEVTNTAVIRFSQLEYDYGSKTPDTPLILLGGVVEQFVSTNANNYKNEASHTNYIHVGSNVWFKLFSNGCHMDKTNVATPHRPISVTGGEYEKFYLSGYFKQGAPVADNADDKNAECYIDGGRFGEVAGASQEKVDGNVTWVIKNADIKSFYGGGINEAGPVTGDIKVTIHNSHVGLYCGGPKFGNMTSTDAKKAMVETTATCCTFGDFFGAGYGGTALYRDIWSPGSDGGHNRYTLVNYNWKDWLDDNRGYHRGEYVAGKGIAVSFETEQFEGSSTATVARLYVNFATMSTASTNGVTSRLTNCIINNNFYGGGNLGSVTGDINSTLKNCKVFGNVFGAGCSAAPPTAEVFDEPDDTSPNKNFKGIFYNTQTGAFEPTDYPDAVVYTWSNTKGSNANTTPLSTLIDEGTGENAKHWIHTDVSLSGLGTVDGVVTLNIEGNTIVEGKVIRVDEDGNVIKDAEDNPVVDQKGGVFGGGDASAALGDVEVNIDTPSLKESFDYNVYNVFGGGNKAEVQGSTTVNLKNGVISNNVFGGGNQGVVTGSATVNIEVEETP